MSGVGGSSAHIIQFYNMFGIPSTIQFLTPFPNLSNHVQRSLVLMYYTRPGEKNPSRP
ncbi:hypothetical protein HMPREF9374_1325 [Desmospora sp. 8437]|nr:hypothetical protein HMPREF9374_1325 [Desmospora sp. 8437]